MVTRDVSTLFIGVYFFIKVFIRPTAIFTINITVPDYLYARFAFALRATAIDICGTFAATVCRAVFAFFIEPAADALLT
tara:strand:- start:8686 stop:8922 length:237 start_codon:yes stop_codon:yes gene_type:complete